MSQDSRTTEASPISFKITFPDRRILESVSRQASQLGDKKEGDKPNQKISSITMQQVLEKILLDPLKIFAPRGQHITVEHVDP